MVPALTTDTCQHPTLHVWRDELGEQHYKCESCMKHVLIPFEKALDMTTDERIGFLSITFGPAWAEKYRSDRLRYGWGTR